MGGTRGFGILLTAFLGASALAGVVLSATAQASVTGLAAGLPDAGNPNGHFPVPPAGRAVSTSHPNRVVGNGSPASCTSAAVVRAVAAGGIIRFNCGKKPVTIVMRATAVVPKTRHLVVLDGRGLVTLSGNGKRRILFSDTCAGTWSTDDCVNQPYPKIVVQNLTFKDGRDGTHQATCTANEPKCWYGGVDGGGAIYVEGGQFKAVNSRFAGNTCYRYGPDLGGGAIRVLAQYRNRPVYITRDTFTGGRCSNGGALSSISVQWDVLNSVFTGNKAIGWGANPALGGTPGGGSGGAIFYVVDSGWGKLTLNESHLHHNPSGEFQTFPGIYDNIDQHDGPPIMIHSTDN